MRKRKGCKRELGKCALPCENITTPMVLWCRVGNRAANWSDSPTKTPGFAAGYVHSLRQPDSVRTMGVSSTG
jgi:hypothetical protein